MSIAFEEIDSATIKRTDENGNEVFIPVDPDNGFYRRYLRWLETGSELPQS